MEMPKYHEIYIPVLKILSNGETLHRKDLEEKVRDTFYSHLPEEVLNRVNPKNGDNTLLNRIHFAKSKLRVAKMVDYPERGYVKITDKGLNILKEGINLTKEYIQNDFDFQKYQKNKKSENNENIKVTDLSSQEMIEVGYADIEENLKIELLEKLKVSNPYYFEKIILKLFQKMGYGDFQETKKSGDGGIDGIINQDALGVERIYTQAKRYTANLVGEKEIRNFIGAMSGDVSKGIFVTTSDFDKAALEKVRDARNHKIILINGDKLVDLMIKYNLGVQIKETFSIKEIDEDFFIED
ncbi:MAG: restriction endonuclease [Candidatus Pacebacteria bacterium]|nr:restriction endonuclease [Candidatus Paceibacterota bacterium]